MKKTLLCGVRLSQAVTSKFSSVPERANTASELSHGGKWISFHNLETIV